MARTIVDMQCCRVRAAPNHNTIHHRKRILRSLTSLLGPSFSFLLQVALRGQQQILSAYTSQMLLSRASALRGAHICGLEIAWSGSGTFAHNFLPTSWWWFSFVVVIRVKMPSTRTLGSSELNSKQAIVFLTIPLQACGGMGGKVRAETPLQI